LSTSSFRLDLNHGTESPAYQWKVTESEQGERNSSIFLQHYKELNDMKQDIGTLTPLLASLPRRKEHSSFYLATTAL